MARVLTPVDLWSNVFQAAMIVAEAQAVIDAHLAVLAYRHRSLLIVAPARPADEPALAAALEASGLTVARRALDDEPTADMQVLVAEDQSELGLWYRLASVTKPLVATAALLAVEEEAIGLDDPAGPEGSALPEDGDPDAGFGGAPVARRIPVPVLRGLIAVVGFGMTAVFFWRLINGA